MRHLSGPGLADTMMNSTQPNPSSLPESDAELLSAYLDNQLSVAERLHIERRMEAEPGLRVGLESLRATVGALRDLEPVRPPRSFTLDPAKVARPRPFFPLAWVMQMGSGLAGLALVLLATVQMLAFGALPAAPAAMSTKSAPAAESAALPTDTTIMSAPQAPAPDARVAEATANPAAGSMAAGSAPAAQAPAATAAPAATIAPAAESAPMADSAAPAPTSDSAAMVAPSPEAGGIGSGGGAPPPGGAGGPPSIDQTTDALQASGNSSPDTVELPAAEAPAMARPQGVPPGLTLAIGVALMGLAAAWYLAGRRA